jgi:uncharacterized protein YbjT (DUF2867 family)
MKQVVVAGATGYLGQHIIRSLQAQNIPFKAIARNPKKLSALGLKPDQIVEAEVTKPDTLKGIFKSSDHVISTVGITRQKDGLTYKDVDYQANKNLLDEAKAANVAQFVYVSVINGNSMRQLKIMEAKEQFVDELATSNLNYTIVRPNGFFSDLSDFLEMAKKGKVYLFGDGEFKLNPIDGSDLAQAIIDNLEANPTELIIGGPDILTQNEIAELALKALDKPVNIVHIPDWIRKLIISLLRIVTSSTFYGPYEFFLTMMAQDNIAPRYGVNRVETHFTRIADDIQP